MCFQNLRMSAIIRPTHLAYFLDSGYVLFELHTLSKLYTDTSQKSLILEQVVTPQLPSDCIISCEGTYYMSGGV